MKFYIGMCEHGKRCAGVVCRPENPLSAVESIGEMVLDGLRVFVVEAETFSLEPCDICRAAYLAKEAAGEKQP